MPARPVTREGRDGFFIAFSARTNSGRFWASFEKYSIFMRCPFVYQKQQQGRKFNYALLFYKFLRLFISLSQLNDSNYYRAEQEVHRQLQKEVGSYNESKKIKYGVFNTRSRAPLGYSGHKESEAA